MHPESLSHFLHFSGTYEHFSPHVYLALSMIQAIYRLLNIGAVERHPEELERVYQLGRKEGEKQLAEVEKFLSDKR